MNVQLENNSSDDQFERDYVKAIDKLNKAIKDSRVITKAIEENLNEDSFEKLIVLMRKLMPETLQNLGETHHFLKKYGYNDNTAGTEKDFLRKEKKPDQK